MDSQRDVSGTGTILPDVEDRSSNICLRIGHPSLSRHAGADWTADPMTDQTDRTGPRAVESADPAVTADDSVPAASERLGEGAGEGRPRQTGSEQRRTPRRLDDGVLSELQPASKFLQPLQS